MRIVSGIWGGRRLFEPKGRDVRPTSDKIRGAVFNALRSRGCVVSANVLDGFCGTGALGLEALSQGAATCTFVDSAKDSLDLAKKNAQALGAEGQSKFLLKEMAKIGQNTDKNSKFSLAFLDPPYNKNLIPATLKVLEEGGWLQDGAILVLESEKAGPGPCPGAYTLLDNRVYGDTCVVTLQYRH
jgi:16S rRNA (guanine966-N2)-methyltransferase